MTTPPNPLPHTLPRGVLFNHSEGPGRFKTISAGTVVLGTSSIDPEKQYYRGDWLKFDFPAYSKNFVAFDTGNGLPPDLVNWDSLEGAEDRYQSIDRRCRAHNAACEATAELFGEEGAVAYSVAFAKAMGEELDHD